MKEVSVEEAVGEVLAHDITEIKRGVRKGPAFKKGHIIKEEDIPKLLDLGKKHVFVIENGEDRVHENEGASRLADLAQGEGLERTEPEEGKINLKSSRRGLLKVDDRGLKNLNMHTQVMMATAPNNMPVEKGDKVAGTRIIPLLIDEEKLIEVENAAGDKPILEVKPFYGLKTAIITTGTEVYEGRIEDEFSEVIESKIEDVGGKVIYSDIKPDIKEEIEGTIEKGLNSGAELVICTGGMSVDPDDVTGEAIESTADEIVTYGAPVLPGAMFMLAYVGDVPLIGLPACAMFSKTTIFDLVLPRLSAGEKITATEIAELGHGGLCLDCRICRYPACSFGKC